MIAVVDYGAGNVASVINALSRVGADACVTRDPDVIRTAAGVIVPGVGAAADVMSHLTGHGLVDVLRETIAAGTPYLGICMGMQVLFSVSYEDGEHPCLGVIPGAVRRLPGGQPLPHVGWNQVCQVGSSPLFHGIPDGADFYFVHSYYVDPAVEGWTAATTDYGLRFTSAIARDNVMGTQFHPEKSGRWGLKLLQNFTRMAGAGR
ncbi:MAG: imidazole glycerol phosphate synthase subunit HisH [Sphaerobacter thermophilus]|uniref:Imidazole glycerol phosphate synthase subunit HisH n=1 Tax=Sphaerobacter thermophilus (strain ATCC 49802 / DSM 20745 / KCCM 41009 / NCIMB 13125 / S 6022) TaxID=479434 RepID=D1C289_SPHTD|nr:imidazole glycerol phosphate synthase subunit HisH [Sphaerobacter thermophilus]ACZ38356.1 imidazole glycerol phosphate synthase, glutamine amidotransferase subunit [Sphaerobacter thermophilus DSM 20745]PZN68188.1 MAG: imidazole glycerol phosphate synthase subunit HisH [Sphaerobacter thermophilus]